MREAAREKIGEDAFVEVYIKASVEACIKRDPKGRYKKAIDGQIKDFTGISAAYEVPQNSDIIIDTERLTVEEGISVILSSLKGQVLV